jgi:hypothetical protein
VFIMPYVLFIILLGISCSSTKPEPNHNQSNDTSEEETTYHSTKSSTSTRSYQYRQEPTDGNPLKGLLTSYQWGEPQNNLPHSLEFSYIPLAALIEAPDTYLFETGLEPKLIAASERGNHLILRVYIDYPNLESGLPTFLQNAVSCNSYTEYGGGCCPDYSNPLLQETIIEFISDFGERYDGDNRIAFIQLGLIGFWGEWHTYPHTDWFADDAFQQQIITTFDEVFDHTPIQIRYPSQDVGERTIGFHDDSFAYATVGDVSWFFWSRLESTGTTSQWTHSPMGGEIYPALQQDLFSSSYEVGEYSQDFETIVDITHATYMLNYKAFNGNDTGYIGEQLDQAMQASRNMGYEYTVEEINVTVSNLDENLVDIQLDIAFRNSGVAPFYFPLSLMLRSEQQGEHWVISDNIETVLPADTTSSYSITIEDLPVNRLQSPLSIHLHSDILLDSQTIHWANNEQQSGTLMIDASISCESNDNIYSLGDTVETTNAICFCDVDGILYDIEGTICSID